MDWKEKMRDGMKMIKDACEENHDWSNCSKCPFENLCDAIVGSEYKDMAIIIGDELENEK